MLRAIMFSIAVLTNPITSFTVRAASCDQVPNIPSARDRWAVARRSRVDPAHYVESCRAYGHQFFEAVTTRQAVSNCEDGAARQRNIEILDAEIDAFNDLIAAQCSSN